MTLKVTNTGNDAADIFIPEAANIDTQNLTQVQVSRVTTDAQNNETVINRGEAGFENGIIQGVEENTSIVIRVTGIVSSTATEGSEISVQLGNTGTEDPADPNAAITQNQPDAGGAGDNQNFDVRTQTADGATVTVAGDPVNGQREASAIQTETIGSQPLALPRLEKTNAGVTNGDDNDSLTDNTILYSLNLEVAGSVDPQVEAYSDFPFTPAALEGRAYNASQFDFTGAASSPSTDNLILISDAIPENTTLDSTNLITPDGWTVVYTTTPLTTAADDAEWVATPPEAASSITRIGWVYDANGSAGALKAGTNVPGFEFQVVTTGLTNNTATAIYNIAQVFGATDDGADGVTGLPTYDESGDQNPANLNDDGSFGTVNEDATTTVDGNNLYGYADPDTVDDDDDEDNVDAGNDNSATGSEAGEVNKAIVTPEEIDADLINGPDQNANATGDALGAETPDNNHDFQNLAVATPGADDLTETDNDDDGYFVSTYDPDAITFTNTLKNTAVGIIRNIILEPISPEALLGVDGVSLGGDNADLPADTRVVIIYDEGLDTEQTAAYTYNADGTYTIDPDGTPVVIPSIARNGEVNYQVRINLPPNTQLSTDFEGGNPANALVGGYPAVIAAYVDNGANAGLEADDTYNVTVNQVYTGYLQLVKEARVLRDDGSGLAEVSGMGYDDPDSAKQPAPADVLEYRITYTNISEDGAGGTGNGLLQADDIVITEDGTAGGNNWAVDNDDPAEDGDNLIDTLHVKGASNTVNGTKNGEIQYFEESSGTGNTNPEAFSSELADFEVTDDIVKYQVGGINRLQPGLSGEFTFRRKITSPEDIDNLAPEPTTPPN